MELAIDKARAITIGGERQDNYGHPIVNFLRIAIDWTIMLRLEGVLSNGEIITPQQVARMMVRLKDDREMHTPNPDNIVDGIGYLSCVDRIHRWLQVSGLGTNWFNDKDVGDMVCLLDKIIAGEYDHIKAE